MTFTPDEPSIADEFPGPDEIREFEIADLDDNVYISVAKGWKLVVDHEGKLSVVEQDRKKRQDASHMIRTWIDEDTQETTYQIHCVETLVSEKVFSREATDTTVRQWVSQTMSIHETLCEHKAR